MELALLIFFIVVLSVAVQFFRPRWLLGSHDYEGPERRSGEVEALKDFEWKLTPPNKYRPFLDKPHVAMGVEENDFSNWVQIDRGYLDRLAERNQTLQLHPEEVLGVNEHSKSAIRELFIKVIEHLPKRFPTLFWRKGSTLGNRATQKTYDIDTILQDHYQMLRTLNENVEEDFYLMCPDQNDDFRLQGFLGAFPGGFRSLDRWGQTVRQLHEPVPGYVSRIGTGVDRFFRRMQGNQIVQRFNWSLQIDGPDLFRLDGNNFYPEQGMHLPKTSEDVDINQCYLRVERQSLVCLPESRAVIFCVRSYMTDLYEIKTEGNAQKLADAIESMPEKLGDYKKRPFWAEKIFQFLRS